MDPDLSAQQVTSKKVADPSTAKIRVSLSRQVLEVHVAGELAASYLVSTAANGAGSQADSNCTPTGLHRVRIKIGGQCQAGAVFVARRPTGEHYTDALGAQYPDRDWILSRILWLDGLEPGVNRCGAVDTLRRFIYIHGTADQANIGKPRSHGCIRMRNDDVIDLFERIDVNDRVLIAV